MPLRAALRVYFRDLPIRRKLMAVALFTTAAALVLAGVAIIIADSLLFRQSLERELSALASIVVENSTAAISFEDPRAAAETLATLHARPHVVSACIYRRDATILARYSRPGAPPVCPPLGVGGFRFSANELSLSRPILLQNRSIGTLVLAYDLGELSERRTLYGGLVLAVLLASSLVAFLLTARLRAAIAAPMARLARASSAVAQTRDYSIRAEKTSGDELGLLADAFNEMLAGIQSRDADLRKALIAREEALIDARNARDSMKTTLASIGDAVVSTDATGRIVFANPIAQSLLRLTEPEMIGRPLDEVFRVVDALTREPVESPVAKVMRKGVIAALANHTTLIASDGTEIPIDDSAAPIRESGGSLLGTVLVFRDVTERRRAEQTSRLLASIVESSEDAIISSDLTGRVLSWNSGAERMFGYTAAEMLGNSISVMAPPDRLAEMMGILERVGRGERVEELQSVRVSKDGTPVNVSLTVSPLLDASGRIVGASKIARNITALVHAADRLARVNANLEQTNLHLARSNEDLQRFAFIASHDLQEPLRMITTYAQLLVRAYPTDMPGDASMFLTQIVDGTRRMRELISDLLAYTEISAHAEMPPETVDLNAVMENVRQNLKTSIDESGAEIVCDPMPVLKAAQSHLVPLFQNLIANAIKYRSEEPPRIHVSVRRLAGGLQFSVSDNGIGIDPAYHEKIFLAFQRLHGKKIPGTGIGLAICQRVVERYGGRIWVVSEAGHGATFHFTMPDIAVSSARSSQ